MSTCFQTTCDGSQKVDAYSGLSQVCGFKIDAVSFSLPFGVRTPMRDVCSRRILPRLCPFLLLRRPRALLLRRTALCRPNFQVSAPFSPLRCAAHMPITRLCVHFGVCSSGRSRLFLHEFAAGFEHGGLPARTLWCRGREWRSAPLSGY